MASAIPEIRNARIHVILHKHKMKSKKKRRGRFQGLLTSRNGRRVSILISLQGR